MKEIVIHVQEKNFTDLEQVMETLQMVLRPIEDGDTVADIRRELNEAINVVAEEMANLDDGEGF